METKEVFEILMRESASMLLTYIRSVTGSESAVDDIFQETMLTAWNKLDEFDRSRAFGPWLRGIAKNHALNHFRKSKRDMLMCNEALFDYIEQQLMHFETHEDDSWVEKAKALDQCLDSIPEIYQEAIRIRYMKDVRPAEAKNMLALSTEALKKRLQRGKKLLLICLQRKGILLPSMEASS